MATNHPISVCKIYAFGSSIGLYHFAEYMYKLCYQHINEPDLSWNDFQINHSSAYIIAMMVCLAEFSLRRWYLSGIEVNEPGYLAIVFGFIESSSFSRVVTGVGATMIIFGQYFRIGSMFHAGSNFNHLVQTKKQQGHQLVKTGPYAWVRHPSYFGWFYWAIGTQMLLSNFFILPLWFFAAWTFFSDRIPYEEHHLI
jgi:protein-S-isoprenylcysteine O-methyltransferase